ncbi:AAA family ATPase [Nocardia tengchongensis]|uniref:AAA family ATPase n=1 Tax=Nocardia tengchongensis TaxID=2055889 RepID=UPI0036A264EF
MIEPFVGRVHELSTLDATYCTPGRHRVFLVEGPAGIGKSRLLAESVRHGRAAGLRAITVAATEYERSTPRQVLLDLADQLEHDADGYRYGDGSGDSGTDGDARMVDPGGRTPDHGIATADTRESARWLRHRLAGTPTVLIIDDAHWADPASLRVLAMLIRQSPMPATVVLAYRTGQFPAELGAALRTPRADVTLLSVPPLSTDEATALLPDLTPAHRARLVAAAHGNPLYLQVLAELTPMELDQALRDDPVDTGFGHAALDRTLRAELAHLPPREQLVAQAAAVCGATADTELLSATAEVTRTDLDAAVDDLARRGWLTVTGGTVAFRHPLMRTAAYRLAGPAWRAAAHDRAARFLRTVDAPVLIRARHLEHAFGSRDDLAATELIRAAEQALATAPATSARWIEAAIRLTPDCPADPRPSGGPDPIADSGSAADRDAATRPSSTNVAGATTSPGTAADATRVLLGRALLLSGSAERARDVLEPLLPQEDSHSSTTSPRASANVRHAERIPAAPDAPGLSASNEAVLLYARCERILGRIDSARRLLAGAVERLDPGESGSVQLELAILESQDNRDREAEVRIRALFASGAVRDPAIRAAACTLRSMGQLNSLDLRAARDAYRIAEREFAQLNDTRLLDGVHAVAALGWMAYFLDDQRTGLTHIERAITVCHRHGRSFVLPELHTVHAYSLAKIGRYDDALAAAEDALETARLYGYPGIAPLAGAAKLRILQDTAPAAEVLRWWRTLDALPRPAMRWWRATVDAALAEIAARLPHPARPQPTGATSAALPTAATATLPDGTTSAMLPTAAESAMQPTDIRSATQPTDGETATLPIDAMSSGLPTGATPTTRAGVTTSQSMPNAAGPVTDTSVQPEAMDAQSREHPMRAAELAVGALACLAHGDLEAAGALVERAGEVAERLDLPGQRAVAARARAGYLCARGDLEAAAHAAAAAIAHYGQAGMPVFRAQAMLVAAEIDGKRGDFATATARIAAAREEFAAAGAHELLTAATTAQRKLAGHRSVSGATMLSEREREVAELAARGLTNKDIAEKLFLSPRTVEDHLGRILRKLGLTGRGGIAHKLAELDRPD